MGNFITVLTVTYVVYFMLALAVFDAEAIGDRKLIPEGNLQVRHLRHRVPSESELRSAFDRLPGVGLCRVWLGVPAGVPCAGPRRVCSFSRTRRIFTGGLGDARQAHGMARHQV